MFVRSRLLFTSALPLRNAFRADFQNDFRSVYSIIARNRSTSPLNTIVMFVPQQEAWIVERMGKFHRILDPGLNLLWPIVDKIKYVQSLKEIAIDVPKQSAITADNVTLSIDGVLYLRIVDPYLASYGVEDPEFAITQLAQTTMRAELGQISLDKVFRERESLNISMVDTINKASEAWGITCLRYEIRDIKLPARVQDAMQMQVEAERRKRAAILESEGVRAADINVAEGKRQARILASEAEKQEQINKASGEAQAMLAVAQARARGLEVIASSLAHRTKLLVYKALILPILLYAAETWCLYKPDIRKLDTFHMRCLRCILRIKWQDKIPNTDILRRTNMPGMEAMLMKSQLRWCGHVRRMEDCRLPKAVLYSELSRGKRNRGGQYLRYKDVLKRHLVACGISPDSWEELAEMRPEWRNSVHKGLENFEKSRLQALDVKRHSRKTRPKPSYNYTYNRMGQLYCAQCDRVFKTKFGLASHIRAHNRESKYAASLTLAEQYVGAFNKLARTNNTLILPANAGDVSNLVAQAMSIYSTVSAHNTSDHSQQPETCASIDPLLKLDALTEKSSTLAGSAVPKDDLAEYYSDDEEREKALEQRNKEKAHKLDRET
ncbi:unnamed protein product [Plutella xylostella]|uniref:(diamondback moth) hypothetical protein n=1 Tax=Plutella xylostella TaxID=51655 RepID=A0A8S4F4B9_PLUXY|nr:unnamed protein product [Plutella xylostella]